MTTPGHRAAVLSDLFQSCAFLVSSLCYDKDATPEVPKIIINTKNLEMVVQDNPPPPHLKRDHVLPILIILISVPVTLTVVPCQIGDGEKRKYKT